MIRQFTVFRVFFEDLRTAQWDHSTSCLDSDKIRLLNHGGSRLSPREYPADVSVPISRKLLWPRLLQLVAAGGHTKREKERESRDGGEEEGERREGERERGEKRGGRE